MTSTKKYNIVFAAGSRPALQPYCVQLDIAPLSPDGPVVFHLEDTQVTALKVALSGSGIEPTSNWPKPEPKVTTSTHVIKHQVRAYHVPQRTFVVAPGTDEFGLKTGYLGPCVAFYGRNRTNGVSFMAHIDGSLAGIDSLTTQLQKESCNRLQDFDLYVCSNYTLWLRFFALMAPIAWAVSLWSQGSCVTGAAIGLAVAIGDFSFTSLIKICRYSKKTFDKYPRPCMPWQVCGRVEVESDPNSPTGFSKPKREHESSIVTKFLYAIPDKSVRGLLDGRDPSLHRR